MISSCFSYHVRNNLVEVAGNQDSTKYCNLLRDDLLLFEAITHGDNSTYQQGNATIHRSAHKHFWLSEKNIDFLTWTSRFPDKNPMENLWNILARLLYANFQQFESVEEHLDCFIESCHSTADDTLHNLVRSSYKGCVDVLQNKGGLTWY